MQVKLIKQPLFKTFFILVTLLSLFIIINSKLLIESNSTLILIQQIILLSPVLYFLKYEKYNFNELGFKKINFIRAIGNIILGFLAYFMVSIAIHIIKTSLNIDIPGYGEQQSYIPIFEGLNIVYIFIIAAIIVPIVEETLFRGLIFKQISGSNQIKILISSLFFAIFHFQFEVFIPLLILGIIFGNLRVAQNSIFVPILFHIINNSIAVYLNFFLLNT
jgi:uncharacterized protein